MSKTAKKIKDLIVGNEAREILTVGVNKIIQAIGTTLGPKGQNVLIDSGHPAAPSTITKDGVTVLRNLQLNDPIENLAVKLFKQASEKTVDECGDGTTTTAILAGAIYLAGTKHLIGGNNPIMIKRGIDKVVIALVKAIDEIKVDVTTDDQIRNIATISANGDEEIGSLIVQAMDKVGKKGIITVENGKSMEDELETTDGLKIDRGFASAYFVTNPAKNTAELANPMILVTDYEFQTANDVIPLLEIAHSKSRPLLLIAEGGSAEALQTLIVNKLKGTASVCAIDAPGFGARKKEYLKDIAAMVGAEFISEDYDLTLEQITYEMLGSCEKAIVSKFDTTIVNSKGTMQDVRLKELEGQMELADNEYDKEFYKERIAKMTGGIAVIRVGGASETEVEEKKDRIDDALGATNAAVDDGIVVGGGCALLHASNKIDEESLNIQNDDEAVGVQIILDAIKQPLNLIVENGGGSGSYVVEHTIRESLNKESYGYNAATERFGNLLDMGIIDPAKVTKSALQNAASIATLLLTSKTILMKQNQVTAVHG